MFTNKIKYFKLNKIFNVDSSRITHIVLNKLQCFHHHKYYNLFIDINE